MRDRLRRIGVGAGWALMALAWVLGPATAAPAPEPGYIAVAADRGFQGNEEIRDAFDAFAAGRNAELVFATDERTRDTLGRAFERLGRRGAKRAIVLPVFLSAADPKWQHVKQLLAKPPLPLSVARPFGESYLAVEALADRLRTVAATAKTAIVVAGYGADSAQSRKLLEQDWQRIVAQATAGANFARAQTVVWYDGRTPDRDAKRAETKRALADAAQGVERAVVVPFHFGRRLDGMMSFDAELQQSLPAGAQMAPDGPEPEALLTTWMTREANRHADLSPRDVGVILLAHGSDYHWNETMREAIRPLEARYPVEYVFSMADQPLIERAVRRLEKRGAKAAVVVRVFGQESSFKAEVERMIGADVEGAGAGKADGHGAHHDGSHEHGGHGRHGSHGHGDHGHGEAAAVPPPRIRSVLPIATVGGVESHPLFAAALLDRARELSRDPRKETIILTAHGTGEDARNKQWLELLSRLAEQMKAAQSKSGSAPFRDIRFVTWREDWPDKRGAWINAARDMVEEAGADGGRALVIPARTNGRGPERTFLAGMQFDLGEGFAPHPLFLRWFEEQVEAGVAVLSSKCGCATLLEPPRGAGRAGPAPGALRSSR
jgi:sirohydrochlorin ferrochelatase